MFLKEQIFDFEYEGTKYYYLRKSKADNIRLEKDKDGNNIFRGVYKCTRCGGKGESWWQRDNGICYECRGLGHTTIKLDVTKNISTAERRLQAIKDKEDTGERLRIRDNLQRMINLYGNEFVLILDTPEYSTYKSREYLKSKGAWWNPEFGCWWTKKTAGVITDFKDFKLLSVKLETVLNEYNIVDSNKLRRAVLSYMDELESKKGVVIQ